MNSDRSVVARDESDTLQVVSSAGPDLQERLAGSVAELDAPTKNAHSHRALAAAQMRGLMREAWRL